MEKLPKIRISSFYSWSVILVLLTLNVALFCLQMSVTAEELRVQYVPDDGYYYLTLARNYASFGQWTFDSGISQTSGFHLLFAYLLSGVFRVMHPDAGKFVIYGIGMGVLFVVCSIFVYWYWGAARRNAFFIMFLALLVSSRNFVYNTVSVTEWALVVFIASSYCVWFFTHYPATKLTQCFFLFLIGFLGSLARSDFGLLPFSILVSVFVLHLIRPAKTSLLFPLLGFLGALAGLLAVFTHNYILTDAFLQSSARMKAYWAQFTQPSYFTGPLLIGTMIGLSGLVFFAVLITISILPRFLKKGEALSNQTHAHFHLMLLSAGICTLGYMLFYSRSDAIQPWYTANLIAPLLLLIFAVTDSITQSFRHAYVWVLFSLLFLAVLLSNILNLYPLSTAYAPWPHQKIMFQAGQYLDQNPVNGRVGAWNAGIIGFYEGGHVVNLDGLVNNDIYRYAVKNLLPAYLYSRGIDYIVDFENMLVTESLRIRGGYNDGQFLMELTPIKVFDQGEFVWKNLTLYRIERETK